ncbi:hypothetical protein CHISP_3283 [Chitinispirillum alkaliphilum]|nr:hypothetical protein CHISP_3283 [Chitinispirillum alkaliphilum]
MAKSKPMFFAFHLKFSGNISLEDLNKALSLVRKVYPLSAVRVEFKPPKKQILTTQNVPDYSVKVEQPDTDWKQIVASELGKEFDDSTGPMVKFNMIPNQDTTHLVAIFHHAVSDGMSAVLFLKKLYRILCTNHGAEQFEVNWAPTLTEFLTDDIKDELTRAEFPDWLKYKKHLQTEIVPRPEDIPFESTDFHLYSLQLNKENTLEIIKASKEYGVTVHSYLGAILLLLFADEFGEKQGYQRVIQCPVSFRPFMKNEASEAFGIYNGIIKSKIDCSPGRSFESVILDIHNSLHKMIKSTDTLKHYYFFIDHMLKGVSDPEALFYSRKEEAGVDYDFSLSNVGVIKFDDSENKSRILECHGPIFSAQDGEIVIGVNTAEERLSLTMIFEKDRFPALAAQKIMQKLESKLASFNK